MIVAVVPLMTPRVSLRAKNRTLSPFANAIEVRWPDGVAVAFPHEPPYDAHVKLALLRPEDPRVEVEHHVIEGEPAVEILKMASSKSADIIVMGTHGHTGLTRLLVGSVAEDVMRKAPCPVLTIRDRHQTPPPRGT